VVVEEEERPFLDTLKEELVLLEPQEVVMEDLLLDQTLVDMVLVAVVLEQFLVEVAVVAVAHSQDFHLMALAVLVEQDKF
jgi:hypothetical protein